MNPHTGQWFAFFVLLGVLYHSCLAQFEPQKCLKTLQLTLIHLQHLSFLPILQISCLSMFTCSPHTITHFFFRQKVYSLLFILSFGVCLFIDTAWHTYMYNVVLANVSRKCYLFCSCTTLGVWHTSVLHSITENAKTSLWVTIYLYPGQIKAVTSKSVQKCQMCHKFGLRGFQCRCVIMNGHLSHVFVPLFAGPHFKLVWTL